VLEAAATGAFSGPLVLLAPSLPRRDEPLAPRVLDRLSTVFGHLPYAAMLRFIGSMLKGGPSTTVRTIAGTGHFIPNTRPDIVANLITQALHEDRASDGHIAEQSST
jgi:hypothetical protein